MRGTRGFDRIGALQSRIGGTERLESFARKRRRPLQNRVAIAYNLFSLRCLSVIRNCVQIRTLCTRQQFLYHLSLLSVFNVRVIARDSQAGMSNLILHEVAGHHTRLHKTDSSMPEGVHASRTTGEEVPRAEASSEETEP